MSARFEPIEIFEISKLALIPSKLTFSSPYNIRYYKLELFRLLTGISSFKCLINNDIVIQRNNFSVIPFKFNKNLNYRIGRYISTDPILMQKKLTNNENRGFYDEILNEFYCYFYEINLNNHTNGFLHLYRILERIAIALPLVYAACNNNYKGIYSDWKKFINDEKTGELKVIQKFISSFVDNTILDQTFDIDIKNMPNNWHENHFNAFLKLKGFQSSIPYNKITYKYNDLIELTIKIRNSYFHALTGANNSFTANEIISSSHFFKVINPFICNWLSFLIIKILKMEINR